MDSPEVKISGHVVQYNGLLFTTAILAKNGFLTLKIKEAMSEAKRELSLELKQEILSMKEDLKEEIVKEVTRQLAQEIQLSSGSAWECV